jgi:hypothetical protein
MTLTQGSMCHSHCDKGVDSMAIIGECQVLVEQQNKIIMERV